MASLIKIKRSAVAGKRPTTSNIENGELALNTADGRLFSSDGSLVFEIGANVHSLSVGTGGITIGNNAFTLPITDGNYGEILQTDGSGNVTWGDSLTSRYKSYTYTASNNQTVFTGADVNAQTLTLKPEQIAVYLNGVKLTPTTDYTANSSAVTLTERAGVDDILQVESFGSASIVSINANLTENTTNSNTIDEYLADSWSSTEYRSAKYMVQIERTGNANAFQVAEVLLVHNGSAVFMTEYGTVKTSANVASIDADLVSGQVRLKINPFSADTKTRVTRLSISS